MSGPHDPDDYDDPFDFEPDDDGDDDDFDLMSCGMMPDGQCQNAGSEWCDWECPIRRARMTRPPLAAALVAANYREAEARPRRAARDLPLFLPAAE